MTVLQSFRDQYQSACLYIRHLSALYARISHQVKRTGMNAKEMLMFMKYIEELNFVPFPVLGFLKTSMIMSEYMASKYKRNISCFGPILDILHTFEIVLSAFGKLLVAGCLHIFHFNRRLYTIILTCITSAEELSGWVI